MTVLEELLNRRDEIKREISRLKNEEYQPYRMYPIIDEIENLINERDRINKILK